MFFVHLWWSFQNVTGTSNVSGRPYGFWSGWGSVFVLPVLITLGHYLVNRFTHVCHEPGCYRKGKHPVAGGKYVVCKYHHPGIPNDKITHDDIKFAHEEHELRSSGKL